MIVSLSYSSHNIAYLSKYTVLCSLLWSQSFTSSPPSKFRIITPKRNPTPISVHPSCPPPPFSFYGFSILVISYKYCVWILTSNPSPYHRTTSKILLQYIHVSLNTTTGNLLQAIIICYIVCYIHLLHFIIFVYSLLTSQ